MRVRGADWGFDFNFEGCDTVNLDPNGFWPSNSVDFYVAIGVQSLPDDATLTVLSSSVGQLDPDFDPETVDYTVLLPYGSTEVPTLTAMATNLNATVEITNAISVTSPNIADRTSTILVTSEDLSQQMTYSIVFNVDQNSDISSLADINLSFGELDPEFSYDILNYVVMLPETTTQTPTIDATTTDPNASVDISDPVDIFSAIQEERTASITVTAENGVNQTVYEILFNVEGITVRDYVIFEKFSGIFCGACPTAIENIHTLIEEGADIGVISYQSASSYSHPYYENPDADGMYNYYTPLISGFPTTIVDGHIVPTFNIFEEYEAAYEERKHTLPAFGVQFDVTDSGNNEFAVDVIVEKVSNISTGILRVVLTESHIDQLWKGESELNAICRKMMPPLKIFCH